MVIPADKERFIDEARTSRCSEIEEQYQEGLITDGERYNKVIDIWAQATEQVADADDRRASAPTIAMDDDGNDVRSPELQLRSS